MKKSLLSVILVFIFGNAFSQQAVLTVTNTTGTYTLTCATPSINLTADVSPSNSSLTYTWISQAASYSGTNVSITAGGIYTVTAFNTASSFSTSQTFTIRTNTYVPTVSTFPSNPVITCLSPTVNLNGYGTSSIPPNSGFLNISPVVCTSWSGVTNSVNTCSYVAAAPGVYTLTVTDLNNGCTGSATKLVSDNRIYPMASSGSPFNILCPTPTAVIFPVIAGSTAGFTYSWTAPSGAVISSSTAQNITVNSPGMYMVMVTNTINGCATNVAIDVQICVGLQENTLRDLRIYPNPATGIISIALANQEQRTLQIYNASGQLVKQQMVSGENATVSIKDLPDGIYFIKSMSDGKTSGYMRLVKLSAE